MMCCVLYKVNLTYPSENTLIKYKLICTHTVQYMLKVEKQADICMAVLILIAEPKLL